MKLCFGIDGLLIMTLRRIAGVSLPFTLPRVKAVRCAWLCLLLALAGLGLKAVERFLELHGFLLVAGEAERLLL